MKQVHASYSFVASTKTITLTGLNIDQDQLLLIVNATRGVQYFNFADSSLRGVVTPGANTTVVLTDASTTGHANGDALVIYYDDQVTSQVVSGTVTANPGTNPFTVTGSVALDPASLIALENVTVTVGSSVALAAGSAQIGSVTISNFPSTQTIAGTVTANGGNFVGDEAFASPPEKAAQLGWWSGNNQSFNFVGEQAALPVQTLNSVTIGSLPAISGTVTANLALVNFSDVLTNYSASYTEPFPVFIDQGGNPLNATVTIGNSVTIGSLPSGALTTRFGSVTTANTAQITSAVTNTSRKYLLAQNISAGTVTIGIGFSPTTTKGIQLIAGGGLTFDAFCPTGAVYWLGAVTGAAWTILEG